ncbi:hypothetical protein Tco_0813094 [Tanacetum coccineum]
MTHPHPKRSFVPQAVLTRTGKINTAGANVNTAGASVNTVIRPVNAAASTSINNIINTNVNTARVKNTTARDRAVVSDNKGIWANAVKASACWFIPEVLFEGRLMISRMDVKTCIIRLKCVKNKKCRDTKIPQSGGLPTKVGDEVVHKELGERMKRVATTASILEAEQDSEAQTRFEAASNSPMTHLSQELTHLEVGRTNGVMDITATIDRNIKVLVTEASIRRHLKLEDSEGLNTLLTAKNFEQLALIGITSSPSISPHHTAEEAAPMPHDSSHLKKVEDLQSDLKQTKLTYGVAYTKLIMRMKKLEKIVKQRKARRRTKMVVSDDEEVSEDPSKQGRIIAEIDQNPSISLPTELVEDPGIGEKGEKEISTVEVLVSTASAIPEVSTAIPERQVYIRRSAEKRKDKGKTIMKDDESVQKKTKKQLEQERLGHEEAIRLQEQINKEERQRISRDAEIAKQLQEEIDIARQEQEKYDLAQALELQKELDKRKEAKVRKNMCMYLKNQGGYKQSHFKRMSYDDVRLIFERVWDQNHSFVPKDSEIEKEVMKRPEFDIEQKQPTKEEKLKINDDSSKSTRGSRKKILARKRAGGKDSEESVKKQKLEDDAEKEELKAYLDIVPGEEFAMEVESLATKYPIVDWKTHILTENFMYYQIIRADGSSKNYKIFSEMLNDFDRQDVMDLHRLNGIAIYMMVEKKYPLIQEMLSKMLNRRLEIDHESEMAFELLRFTRSQLQQ